jgi:hypothetical protein
MHANRYDAAGAGTIAGRAGKEPTMIGKRWSWAIAGAIVPLALAVQSVLAVGDVPPERATPEPTERSGSIDPGFAVRAGENVDPGFVVVVEDRSNDTGFIVIPGTPSRGTASPTPALAPATPPAIASTLGAP